MNVEQSYIKCNDIVAIEKMVKSRLNGELKCNEIYIDYGVENSYQTILADEPKRKVAIAKPVDGWMAVLESKEVNDYDLF